MRVSKKLGLLATDLHFQRDSDQIMNIAGVDFQVQAVKGTARWQTNMRRCGRTTRC